MAENDTAPSSVTLAASYLLRQGLGATEVSRRTGLPLALVELIAAEQSGPAWDALVPGHDTPRWRGGRVITTVLATLAVTSLIGALASAVLRSPSLGRTSGGLSAVSLLAAVHTHTRPRH